MPSLVGDLDQNRAIDPVSADGYTITERESVWGGRGVFVKGLGVNLVLCFLRLVYLLLFISSLHHHKIFKKSNISQYKPLFY